MLLSSIVVYFPFRHDFSVIYRYWDGPLYLYLAKTLYRIPADHPFVAYQLPQIYFASHLPLYPLLIRLFAFLTFGHYPAAMLLVTLGASVASAVLFFRLLQMWDCVVSPFWTAILFCFLPPRWLIYHSVGATEPLFLCCIFTSFLAYRLNRPALVVLSILAASLTRVTGILLVPVFVTIYLLNKEWRRSALMLLACLGLIGLFVIYRYTFHDFFAYFRWNAGQHQIFVAKPLEIFRLYARNQNFHSTELYIWTYVVYGLGTLLLWRRKEFFIFTLIFFLFHTCIYHLDLSRYMLVIAPFSLLIAFDPILSRPASRWILPLVLYLDYLYVWGYIPFNTASPETFTNLLKALQ